MAKKLYEEENIRAIAEIIREKTISAVTYTTAEMPNGVNEVYNRAWERGYGDGYSDGASSELDALYDFYVQATPTGVEVWVTNYHPIYELEIRVIINNITTGRTHNEIFVIDADEGDFYWASDDEIFSSSESNTYNISVEGVRWIK